MKITYEQPVFAQNRKIVHQLTSKLRWRVKKREKNGKQTRYWIQLRSHFPLWSVLHRSQFPLASAHQGEGPQRGYTFSSVRIAPVKSQECCLELTRRLGHSVFLCARLKVALARVTPSWSTSESREVYLRIFRVKVGARLKRCSQAPFSLCRASCRGRLVVDETWNYILSLGLYIHFYRTISFL